MRGSLLSVSRSRRLDLLRLCPDKKTGRATYFEEVEKLTLYEIQGNLMDLITMMEEDPENPAIEDTLKLVLLDLDDKIDDYYAVIRQLEADAEATKAEKMRLAKKQSAAENGAKRMRDALKYAMLMLGKTKYKTPRCTMSISTRWKAVLDADPREIPEEFQKVTIEARMSDIEKYLKGYDHQLETTPASVCEWAHLEQAETLTIR